MAVSERYKPPIAAQIERVKALERTTGRIIPYLFPDLKGGRKGDRIRDFTKRWKTASAMTSGEQRSETS